MRAGTYVAGNVCVSTGSQDRDGVALDFKLLCFGFLPVVLIAALQRRYAATHESEHSIGLESDSILDIDLNFTHLAQVVGVDSGLDEEGIVRGEAILELCFLKLFLVVQLREKKHQMKTLCSASTKCPAVSRQWRAAVR